MTTRLSAEILQSRCRRLEMVTDDTEHWQTGRLDLQPRQPLNMRCGAEEAIGFMTQQQIEITKCGQ